MRTAFSRYCLATLFAAALPASTHASLAYSVKREGAEVFRGDKLEPPPLAALPRGESLRIIQRGEAASLIETEGGIKGWMRNGDILAIAEAKGRAFRLKGIDVSAGTEFNHSPAVIHLSPWDAELLKPERDFAGEVIEAMDREQVEMRHDEN